MNQSALVPEARHGGQDRIGRNSPVVFECPVPLKPLSLRILTSDLCSVLEEAGCPLAETQNQLHDRLVDLTPTDSEDLRAAWEAHRKGSAGKAGRPTGPRHRLGCRAVFDPGDLPG
jgi:hypothetical protein